ncbi:MULTISPECIES: MFS transporter [Brevibacterium]|uniref:Predicted arabinose efflux permease, MFS family n=2 Tax=Brevibacterium TaxID=1696 RepID=A0A1H1XIL6_BRESA|nr:MFS transporter [Brevibacterium sandarakinum]SDT08921.1 Predicted arabinose efflux permease, MFS family [Brevibacterium sandarakinum]
MSHDESPEQRSPLQTGEGIGAENSSRSDSPDVGTNRDALGVPAFRRLTLAWLFSNFGDSALFLTAAIWVKQLTNSDAPAGLVFAALGLPALLAPLTGQLADRFKRRTVLIVNCLCTAAVVLALLAVESADQVWLIYLVIFAYANSSYITAATQSGLLRDMLTDRLLPPANGILSSLDQGLRIVSPLIGAGMLALWGMDSVVLLTCACFIVAAAVLMTLSPRETQHDPGKDESFWQASTAGVRFLVGHSLLGPALLTLSIALGVTGVFNVTIFATTEQGIDASPEFLSVLVSIQGAMAVIGGLTASTIIRRIGIRATVILGVSMLGLAVLATAVPSVPVVIGGVVLLGVSVTWPVVAFVSLRQQETPAHLQGRTSAATNVMVNVPQVGASMIAAALIGAVDYRILIVATAVVCFLGSIPLVIGRNASSSSVSTLRT